MTTIKVWFSGVAEEHKFLLETDELFEAYARFLQSNVAEAPQGFVYADQRGQKVGINFHNVSMMSCLNEAMKPKSSVII